MRIWMDDKFCQCVVRMCWRVQVAQLSGFVSADTAYHHGETSLQSTIIGLAHNFVGSNNVNVLVPAGKTPSSSQRILNLYCHSPQCHMPDLTLGQDLHYLVW